jgi:dethiobiotin synthetase
VILERRRVLNKGEAREDEYEVVVVEGQGGAVD